MDNMFLGRCICQVLKLLPNENPFGPSRAAIDAMASAGLVAHRYLPTDHACLRTSIGAVHGLDPERIIVGVSFDEVLTLLAMTDARVGYRKGAKSADFFGSWFAKSMAGKTCGTGIG